MICVTLFLESHTSENSYHVDEVSVEKDVVAFIQNKLLHGRDSSLRWFALTEGVIAVHPSVGDGSVAHRNTIELLYNVIS